MSSSNCCFLTCMQISQEAGQVVWYSHLFKNFLQFAMVHTAKDGTLLLFRWSTGYWQLKLEIFLWHSKGIMGAVPTVSKSQSCLQPTMYSPQRPLFKRWGSQILEHLQFSMSDHTASKYPKPGPAWPRKANSWSLCCTFFLPCHVLKDCGKSYMTPELPEMKEKLFHESTWAECLMVCPHYS